jgi:hypothetical protein
MTERITEIQINIISQELPKNITKGLSLMKRG